MKILIFKKKEPAVKPESDERYRRIKEALVKINRLMAELKVESSKYKEEEK